MTSRTGRYQFLKLALREAIRTARANRLAGRFGLAAQALCRAAEARTLALEYQTRDRESELSRAPAGPRRDALKAHLLNAAKHRL